MASRTVFRFEADSVSFELAGSEEFVKRHLPAFMPFVGRATGLVPPSAASPAAGEEASSPKELKAWYDRHVPAGTRISMQDSILVFALWMRGFKKYIFTSEDIRRAFEELGMPEPKSLLQILGTLKRDHNLILGTERRGEYMLNTTGIERARQLLGMPASAGARPAEAPAAPPAAGHSERDEEEASGNVAAARLLGDI